MTVLWSRARSATMRSSQLMDVGVKGAVVIGGDRWVIAHEDGALVITSLGTRPRADLDGALHTATQYKLPRPP